MADANLQRRTALDGLSLQTISGVVSVGAARAYYRYSLRGDAAALQATLGIAMPTTPLRAEVHTDRCVLWLGPDEWLLLDTQARAAATSADYAVVDVTDRSTGLSITGPRAVDLLSAGCPLDLDIEAFPDGMCVRTIFAKAEIVLWRVSAENFYVDVWRSFAHYIVGVLNVAIRDLD